MADQEEITDGSHGHRERIAGTVPGISDGVLLPSKELPEERSEEDVARIAKKLGAPVATRDE
jgi:hypothetical protein